MGWFGFGGNNEVVDLGERFQKKKTPASKTSLSSQKSDSNVGFTPFPFFADAGTSSAMSTSSSSSLNSSGNVDLGGSDASEKRRKLVNRLKSMTDRLEDLSSQVYRLQQRVELLEKKSSVGY